MKLIKVYLSIFILFSSTLWAESHLLISGVCRNIEAAIPNTISNIEQLGERFDSYEVIIYENNSQDRTAELLSEWALRNPSVCFVSETLEESFLPASREERIARARNIVLEIAKDDKYKNCKHVVMADLDFLTPWPIDEIVASTKITTEWDCISANGVFKNGKLYWDRYAFRDINYPFGPEIIGNQFWHRLFGSWFGIKSEKLKPVFSAFGGLAIYKRETLIQHRYSGTVTKELQDYYGLIASQLPLTNSDLNKYLSINRLRYKSGLFDKPIWFQSAPPSDKYVVYKSLVCCEHVTLHASMALNGHGKFYINPKLIMDYGHH